MKRARESKPFAKRSLGQNFLVDPSYISKIIDALEVRSGDIVVEIGPGRGALTERLVATADRIIAVEIDRDLVPLLRDRFKNDENLIVIEADVLKIDLAQLVPRDIHTAPNSPLFKVVANLPYYISTAVLQKLAEQRHLLSTLVLMFQREVVDRITAAPGNSDRGFLTVLTEAFFEIERLFDVPAEAFRPQPKVRSSVVRLTPKTREISNETVFRELISNAFRQKRKTLTNNLKAFYPNAAEIIAAAGIDPRLRPEALTIDQWLRLVESAPKGG
ncbi:MAG: 16S rRNA (adenine(1518)-N(6)/adenine(1519)-N(6))-dimethyltransferase RsmA [Acidobacteriota bacterium]